jgi:uracil-DNA glycosylase family 4
LLVIGEAPGFYEATYGQPFKGPSGKLLFQVLNHYEYTRDEVSLANAVSCRPPDNATPPAAAVAACRGRLLHDVERAGARDVLALGGTAAAIACEGNRKITDLRVGPPKTPTVAFSDRGVERVIPSWHPAYCLRNADAFPSLTNDIGKLKDANIGSWEPPVWVSTDDPAEALHLIRQVRNVTDKIVVDIEVGIEKDTSFGHPNEYDLLCVGIAYAKRRAVVIGSGALCDEGVRDALRKLFADLKIIAHNGKFDLAGLWPIFGHIDLYADTMLANYCLDERPGQHGLKVLSVEKLGAPKYDDEIFQYIPKGGNYADIPRPILYKYNAYDVVCTWDLWELLEPQLEAEDVRKVHDFLVKAAVQLMYLELNGITFDRKYSLSLTSNFTERLEVLEDKLNNIISHGEKKEYSNRKGQTWEDYTYLINPRSPKQIKEYFQTKRISVEKTDKDTLDALLDIVSEGSEQYQFIRALLEHRRQQKLFSTYVKGLQARTYRGRIHTTYSLHGTTSGRLSSRRPNLQNIVRDKDIRKQFVVAKEGNVLIQCDYKQAEGRAIATFAQDEYLRSIVSNPEIDMFDELSDQLYGPSNWGKEERIRTKAFFYGLGYGREANSIAKEYDIPLREAQRRMKDFMDLIPATVRWQEETKRKVLAGEDLVTAFGRRRRFWLITKQNQKDVLNEALSFMPQSTASDICLSALTELRPRLRGHGFIRLTIHDALVAECSEEKRDYVGGLMKEVMEAKGREFTDYVPFTVDTSFGTHWGML